MMTTINCMIVQLILFFFGVGNNNDDARNIHQHKTNHTDDPIETLQAEHRIHTLKHKERQPRYTKKSVEYWENTIKTKRKAHKCLSNRVYSHRE